MTLQLATRQFDTDIWPRLPRSLPASTWKEAEQKPRSTERHFAELLSCFESTSLAQMDDVALLRRTDTKYVLDVRHLHEALETLAEHYRILDIDRIRLHPYQTLYFDTADFALYLRHHAGAGNRFKVRSRSYVSTRRSFMEVKFKTKNDQTVKSRIPTDGFVTRITPDVSDFLAAHLPAETGELEPKLGNEFSRITLVNQHRPERLTIDLNLRFYRGKKVVSLPGIVVAEVKAEGNGRGSDFGRVMRDHQIRKMGFSKYCIGVNLLYPQIKSNHFKEQHRFLTRLMQGD